MTGYSLNECLFIVHHIYSVLDPLSLPPSVNSAIILYAILVYSTLVPQWFVEISAKKWMQAEQVMSLVPNIVLCVKFIYTSKEPFVYVVKES